MHLFEMEACVERTETLVVYQEALGHSVTAIFVIHRVLKEKPIAAETRQFAIPSPPLVLAFFVSGVEK